MAVDIEEGDAAKVPIEGAACFYVVMVTAGRELEASVFQNTHEDLSELRGELENALVAKRTIILLRASTPRGAVERWETLEPAVFAGRLRSY
ncbi:MAG: hypothetical protein ACLPWO_03990 [Thermoplasmata archaeon]